jgi:putative spermidine/putrescine transport system substrate-binding protein
LLAALGITTAASGKSARPASGGGKVIVASYGGSFAAAQTKAYFNPFTKATGITVDQTSNSGYAEAEAQGKSHNIEWDVTSSDSESFPSEIAAHLLQKLNYKDINIKGINPAFVSPYGVGYITYADNMAWNTQKYGTKPLTPADFFNTTKYPGKRVLPSDPSNTLEFALLASGVPANKLYPLNVPRALAEIAKIKSSIVGFAAGTDEQNDVAQGEADMAFIPNGRIANAIQAGAKWAYTWKGSVINVEHWAIMKGAPDLGNAEKFINFAIQAKQQVNLAKAIPYGPTNNQAFTELSPALKKEMPSYPANLKQGVLFNGAWWAKNLAKVEPKWNALTLGG